MKKIEGLEWQMRQKEKRIRAGIIYFNFSGYCKIKRNKTRKNFLSVCSLSESINLANSK